MTAIKEWFDRTNLIDEDIKIKCRSKAHEVHTSFVEHPRETGETYGQHLRFTTRTALTLLQCGGMIFIHGLCPFLFTHGVSERIAKLNTVLASRVAKPQDPAANAGQNI